MKKKWYDYLWILSLTYLILGFFNILFAWLGLLCFFIPLIISVPQGTKDTATATAAGAAIRFVGGASASPGCGTSRMDEEPCLPVWISGVFFAMFFLMLWNTWLVFAGRRTCGRWSRCCGPSSCPWHWLTMEHCSIRALHSLPLAFTA